MLPAPPPPPPPAPARQWRPWSLLALLPLAFIAGALLAVAALTLFAGGRGKVALPAVTVSGPDITLTFSPELLRELLAESARRSDAPIRLLNLGVVTADDVLTITGSVDAPLGLAIPARIEMQPIPVEGRLRFRILRARVGPFPIPGDLERLAEPPLNGRIEAATRGLPADVIATRADAAGLTVVARVRVRELPTPTPRSGR